MSWGWDWYAKPKLRRPAKGIRAKTTRGQFGQTWWAGQWIEALERLLDPGRLSRGRSYARSGQVLNLDIKPGRVDSRVQGSRATPYNVRIEIEPLTDEAWDKVVNAMAAQAIFAAKLLAGEMPQNIEEAFSTAKVSLFPSKRRDLVTECSCPDWANPCKHIAAVYYLLGEQFDCDPFLLFRLRGREKGEITTALRARRSAEVTGPAEKSRKRAPAKVPVEKVTPLSDSLDHFWMAADGLENLRLAFTAPEVDAAPVKRLGEPEFWMPRGDFLPRLSQAYAAVTWAAVEQVMGD